MELTPPSLPPSPHAQSSARPTASPPPTTATPDLADGLRRSKRHRSPSRRMRGAMEEEDRWYSTTVPAVAFSLDRICPHLPSLDRICPGWANSVQAGHNAVQAGQMW